MEIIEEISEIKKINEEKISWYHNINNVQIKYKLDTGSDVNILPHDYFKKLCMITPIQPITTKFIAYGGFHVKVVGSVEVKCFPENQH